MNGTVRLTTVAIVAALVCATAAFSQPARGQGAGSGAQAQLPPVISPEILPDKTVTFRLRAPKAGTLQRYFLAQTGGPSSARALRQLRTKP